MADLDALTVALLIGAAFVAGLVDSIAGGGGLITVPAFVLAGFSPLETLATNKAQAVFGSTTATVRYSRAGLVDGRVAVPWAVASGLASALGAVVASELPEGTLDVLIPIALVVVAAFFSLRRDLDDADRRARWSGVAIGATVVPAIGFYDGVFGPGTGSFFMAALVGVAGLGVLRATAHTKVLNAASNLGALCVFAAGGDVRWGIAVPMGVAQVLGASIGSHLAMRRGSTLIRPLLVVVCVVVAARELLD